MVAMDESMFTDLPPLAVCSYSKAMKYPGMPVRMSIGEPRWMPGLPFLRGLAPYGCLGIEEQDAFREKYLARVEAKWPEVRERVLQIAQGHPPGTRLILCCYENIHEPGNWCHRTMLREWLESHGVPCPELTEPPPPPPPSLFDAEGYEPGKESALRSADPDAY
jgi:hypothetical protein